MDEALKKTLIAKAAEVRHNARAFSGFHVGAALVTKSGEIVTGCNVELHTTLSSICAERTAMVKAVPLPLSPTRTSPYPPVRSAGNIWWILTRIFRSSWPTPPGPMWWK